MNPRLPARRHSHAPALTHSRRRPPGRQCPGRARLCTHGRGRRRAGSANAVERSPAPARAPARSPPPAAREQRPAARPPERRLHTPPRHAPRGSGRGGAATVRAAEGAAGPGAEAPCSPPVRPGSADQVGPAGRRPSPGVAGAGLGPGAAGVAWGRRGRGAGHRSGPALFLPCLCPRFCSCRYHSAPVPVPILSLSASCPRRCFCPAYRLSRGAEGGALPTRSAGCGRERGGLGGGHGGRTPVPEESGRSEGSVPSCRAGQKMALAQDRTVRGCPWEGGAWEGTARGVRAPESRSTEGEWSESEDRAKHPARRGESFKHL